MTNYIINATYVKQKLEVLLSKMDSNKDYVVKNTVNRQVSIRSSNIQWLIYGISNNHKVDDTKWWGQWFLMCNQVWEQVKGNKRKWL